MDLTDIPLNRNYQSGRRWEYEVMAQRRELGCTVMRTAGSHGFADVIAINTSGGVDFIQCKVTESETTAKRLIETFRKDPPFKAGAAKFHQTMAVKIKGGTYLSVTV